MLSGGGILYYYLKNAKSVSRQGESKNLAIYPFFKIMNRFVFKNYELPAIVNPLSVNSTKWSNPLKQFVGKFADELLECV